MPKCANELSNHTPSHPTVMFMTYLRNDYFVHDVTTYPIKVFSTDSSPRKCDCKPNLEGVLYFGL